MLLVMTRQLGIAYLAALYFPDAVGCMQMHSSWRQMLHHEFYISSISGSRQAYHDHEVYIAILA